MNSEFFISGKKYISAKRAAKLTGYATDYIGQMCRGGKLDSRMIGRSWFVSEESLLGYKQTITDSVFETPRSGRKLTHKHAQKGRQKPAVSAIVSVDRKGVRIPRDGEEVSVAAPWDSYIPNLASLPQVSSAISSAVRHAAVSVPKALRPVVSDIKHASESIEKRTFPYAARTSVYLKPEMLRVAGNLFLSSALAVTLLVVLLDGQSIVRELPRAIDATYLALEGSSIGVGGRASRAGNSIVAFFENSPTYLSAGAASIGNRAQIGDRSTASVPNASNSILDAFMSSVRGWFESVSLAIFDVVDSFVAPRPPSFYTDGSKLAAQENQGYAQDSSGGRSLVVVPSTGQAEADREITEYIQRSFSDEIEVVSSTGDGSTGVIRPVFKSSKGDEYIYVLVPISDGG